MTAEPGLCSSCRWASAVTSARGARFLRCGRSDFDPRFARYPPLPVLLCAGFEPREQPSQPPPGR